MRVFANGSEIRISAPSGIAENQDTIILCIADAEELLAKLPDLLRIVYDRRLVELIDKQKSITKELESLEPKCGCSTRGK